MRARDHILAARENVRFAARALTAYKLRSALTVLGIVIGVTTVIAMVSIIVGFNNNVTHDFQSFGATLVQFQKFDPQFGPGNSRRVAAHAQEPDVRGRARAQAAVPVDAGRFAGALLERRRQHARRDLQRAAGRTDATERGQNMPLHRRQDHAR